MLGMSNWSNLLDQLLVPNIFFLHRYHIWFSLDQSSGTLVPPCQNDDALQDKVHAGADAGEVAAVVSSTNCSSPTCCSPLMSHRWMLLDQVSTSLVLPCMFFELLKNKVQVGPDINDAATVLRPDAVKLEECI